MITLFDIFLGDSGYANKDYLLTPLLNPDNEAKHLYNEAHIRTRNSVERAIGVWKRRFPILAYGLRYKPEFASNIIIATAVLQNIAIENNEPVPPPPENINEDELNYLIELGNIEELHNDHEENRVNVRQHLINNHFANL